MALYFTTFVLQTEKYLPECRINTESFGDWKSNLQILVWTAWRTQQEKNKQANKTKSNQLFGMQSSNFNKLMLAQDIMMKIKNLEH